MDRNDAGTPTPPPSQPREPPPPGPPGERGQRHFWRYARVLAVPLLLWVLVVASLRAPLRTWLRGEDSYDHSALQEWLEEARGFRETLPEMVGNYLKSVDQLARLEKGQQRLGVDQLKA